MEAQRKQQVGTSGVPCPKGTKDVSEMKVDEAKQQGVCTHGTGVGAQQAHGTGVCPTTGKAVQHEVCVPPHKEGLSVTNIIKIEHAEIKKLYDDYKAASAGEVKEAKAFMMLKEIVQHSGREELVVYPVLREKLSPAIADHSEQEHHEITENLYQLDSLTWAQNPHEFNRLVDVAMTLLNKHINEEENQILPQLSNKLNESELIDLGKKYNGAYVTTRPHPSAPHEGMSASAAHLFNIPIDKARDATRWDQKMLDLAGCPKGKSGVCHTSAGQCQTK